MKKIFVLALCSTLFANISCGKDDDGGSNGNIDGTLTVEEGKEQLEDNSIEILNKIEEFKNNDALNEIIELAEFLSPASTSKSKGFEKTSLNTISNVSNVQANSSSIVSYNAKQALTLVADTPLADDFNEGKGIYQWNATTEEFDKTGDSDDIIYNVAYNGKNAVFSFTDFTTELVGDNEDELPSLVKANLKIDNIVVFSQEYSATFQDGLLAPSKINNTTTIAGFSFVTSYTNTNNSAINQSFEFKIESDVILGFNYTANGDFDNEDGDLEDIVNNLSVTFQFLDARLAVTAKDDNYDSTNADDLTIDEQVELLNNNVDAVLSINNKLIANGEFYKDQDTYTTSVFNSSTQMFEEIEMTEDIVNARFLFEDGTSNDFDTYIEGSFTELEDKFETVFDAYEKLFEDVEI